MILGSVNNLLRGEGEILAGNRLFSDPAQGGTGIFLGLRSGGKMKFFHRLGGETGV